MQDRLDALGCEIHLASSMDSLIVNANYHERFGDFRRMLPLGRSTAIFSCNERGAEVKYRRLLFACIAVLSLVLSACSSSSPTTSSNSSSGSVQPGGTLIAARAADAITWDPAVINENDSLWAAQQVEGTLIKVTPNGKGLEPYIAKSWSISPNGLVYTFHLNPLAKFCNGQQITSADVVYSFTRETSSTAIVSWQFPTGMKMSAPNAETVVLTLPKPEAAFASFLTLWGTAIVSKAYGEKVGSQGLATAPLGSGPFCLQRWQKGTEIDLVRNSYFWLKDSKGRRLPYLNAIKWRIITDDNARVLALESGQVSVITPVPAAQFAQLSQTSGIVASKGTLLGAMNLFVNTKKPCLSSVDVRQALNYALSEPPLIKAVLFGEGTYLGNPLFNARWSTNQYGYNFNLAKAKQLMAASPCAKGFATTAIYQAGDTEAQETLTILKSDWAAIGVQLNLESLESGTLYSDEDAGNFDMYWNLGTNDIYDPAENLHYEMLPVSADGSDAGFTGWNDPTVTSLVLQAESVMNTSLRAQLYNQIQKIYVTQGPLVYLYTPDNLWATRSSVHGFSEYPTGAQDFMYTWLSS
jgi:peptide/nickel transport system substrate-binding protein